MDTAAAFAAPPSGLAPGGDTLLIPVKLCNLPPFHPVAARLMTLSAEAAADLKQVVSIVSADPALAAEILFLANSSLFGFPARIQSLRHAAAVLGTDCVRQLAMTVAVRGLARGTGAFVHDCWRHSMAGAVIGEMLAPIFGCSADQAYSAGLLHDAGRLGFLRTYPAEIARVFDGEYGDARDLMAAERLALQSPHTDAGAWLMEYWVLPSAFGEICAHHHDEPRDFDAPLLGCIKAACRMASALGYNPVRYRSQAPFEEVMQAAVPEMLIASIPGESQFRAAVEARLQAFESTS